MLNAYALQNGGLVRVPAAAGAVPPPEALWIDLFEPTPEEERLIETTLRIAVPTREEMREIESSNRLYEDAGALFMTATVITKLDSDLPESTQITFILTGTRLITVRYVDPLPFRRFIAHAERHAQRHADPHAERHRDALADPHRHGHAHAERDPQRHSHAHAHPDVNPDRSAMVRIRAHHPALNGGVFPCSTASPAACQLTHAVRS